MEVSWDFVVLDEQRFQVLLERRAVVVVWMLAQAQQMQMEPLDIQPLRFRRCCSASPPQHSHPMHSLHFPPGCWQCQLQYWVYHRQLHPTSSRSLLNITNNRKIVTTNSVNIHNGNMWRSRWLTHFGCLAWRRLRLVEFLEICRLLNVFQDGFDVCIGAWCLKLFLLTIDRW